MDLRCEKRFPVHFNSVFTGPKTGDLTGTVLDLSKKGCVIETTSQVYTGMPITLHIDVPDMEPWRKGRRGLFHSGSGRTGKIKSTSQMNQDQST
jgi:hypothetical protein